MQTPDGAFLYEEPCGDGAPHEAHLFSYGEYTYRCPGEPEARGVSDTPEGSDSKSDLRPATPEAVRRTTASGGPTAATGVDLIAAERQRQIDGEGWTPEHDDSHRKGEMALAAAVYAMPEPTRENTILGRSLQHILWPWPGWWKPTPKDRVRELVKAGALIAAEIDRLQRASR